MKSVYVFESNGQFKIGVSKSTETRLRSIKTGNPNVRAVYESEKMTNAHKVESLIHSHFSEFRVNGEWFSIPSEVDVIGTVKDFVAKYGIQEEHTKEDGDKLKNLIERLFASFKEEMEELDCKNAEIDSGNERLKEQLRLLGWSDFDIEKLVDEAENEVLSQYA